MLMKEKSNICNKTFYVIFDITRQINVCPCLTQRTYTCFSIETGPLKFVVVIIWSKHMTNFLYGFNIQLLYRNEF